MKGQRELDVSDEVKTREKEQLATFYQVLRAFYAGRSEQSERVITSFEADPDGNRQELAALLRAHLPEDRWALAQQVQQALGPEGTQFVNLVAGGNVEQLVNIARLGVLVLKVEQTRIFYFFRDVRQVVAFLLTLVLVASAVSYGIWLSRQPQVMTGDFNIAVAEFHETSTPGATTGVATILSQKLATFLDQEYQLINFEEVQVAHDKIGVIREAEQARALAEKIGADLVIYGDVTIVGDEAQITPKFYVVEPFRPDAGEIGGQHQLALPVTFATDDLIRQGSEVNVVLQQRTAILTEFTKGLAYRATGNQVLALEAMDSAITHADTYGDFPGKEVIFMIASDVARLQEAYDLAQQYVDRALALNPNYGRAYIALGNVYYEQGDLFQAQAAYRQALELPDQPFGSYIAEKANLGLVPRKLSY